MCYGNFKNNKSILSKTLCFLFFNVNLHFSHVMLSIFLYHYIYRENDILKILI